MNNEKDIIPEDFDDLSKHAPLLHALRGKAGEFVVPEHYFGDAGEIISAKTNLPESDGFTVPSDYFEESAEQILAVVQVSQHVTRNTQDATVPENYFEDFADKISSLVSLHDLKKEEPFGIPEGYFDEFDKELPTNLALDNIRQDDGFAVPEGYFEKFSNEVLSRASVETLNTGNDADVPESYFDSLADRIANRIAKEEGVSQTESKEKGRIIVFAEVLKRYAKPISIAASAALLIAVSIWFLNRDTDKPESEFADKNPAPKKEMLSPVIPVDTISVQPAPKQAEQKNLAASNPKKYKNKERINPAPAPVVKVEKQDVMDQMDLIDETTVAEYVSDQAPISKEKKEDAFLNDAMQDYLLNDNGDPASILLDDSNKE